MADPLLFYYLAVLVVMILLNTLVFSRLMHQEITGVDYGAFLTMMKGQGVAQCGPVHTRLPSV